MTADENMPRQPSLIMQWIVSLAVSIISCSVLFVIFAAHLVQVQSRVTIDGVRLDAALQRQSQLVMEVSDIRRVVLSAPAPRAPVETDGVVTPNALMSPDLPASQSAAPAQK